MQQINVAGTFRGEVLDRGIGTSTNGYPQLVLQVRAEEQYDEDAKVWSTCEPMETTGYLTLVGGSGKATRSAQQAMKAFGWDGATWSDLQTKEDLADHVQFRMKEDTYNDRVSIKLDWIDAYDANPSRSVGKLDPGALKALDSKWAGALKAIGGGPKPKSAPVAPKAPVQADPTTTPTPAPTPGPTVGGTSDTPTKPARPSKPKPLAPAVTGMTKDEAWAQYQPAAEATGKTEKEISNIWTDAVRACGGDAAVTDWSVPLARMMDALKTTEE